MKLCAPGVLTAIVLTSGAASADGPRALGNFVESQPIPSGGHGFGSATLYIGSGDVLVVGGDSSGPAAPSEIYNLWTKSWRTPSLPPPPYPALADTSPNVLVAVALGGGRALVVGQDLPPDPTPGNIGIYNTGLQSYLFDINDFEESVEARGPAAGERGLLGLVRLSARSPRRRTWVIFGGWDNQSGFSSGWETAGANASTDTFIWTPWKARTARGAGRAP